MKATATSTPNIALIKYWGNRLDSYRLPAADSLSMTLDSPMVTITAELSPTLQIESFDASDKKKELTQRDIDRMQKHLEHTKEFLKKIGCASAIPENVSLTIHSKVPPRIGIASSAAVFSCLAECYAQFAQKKLTVKEKSVIARLGSGSAARSLEPGFVALWAGNGSDIDSSTAEQIASADHWPLCDIIIVPSMEEKLIGSSEGHSIAHTSPLFKQRIDAIQSKRQMECIDAIHKKDFEKLCAVSEEDALDMHKVMETSVPPLKYLTDATHKILKEIESLRQAEHLPVLYTMDAGPTVHLICEASAQKRISEFAHAQAGCTVFEARVGGGARVA